MRILKNTYSLSDLPISLAEHSAAKSVVLEEKDFKEEQPLFKISLAQWSLHRHFYNKKIESTLDFPLVARRQFKIEAVEYVNQFFPDKAENKKYLTELKSRSESVGVNNLLIMCDNEGNLSAKSKIDRNQALENHYKWIDAAKFLECHSIRVNAHGDGTPEEQKNQMIESLSKLAEYGKERGINIIIENHGGLSINAVWLSEVVKEANNPYIGTLPDFGNFPEEINRYEGVEKLMPFAKGVSAKSYDFDEYGNEININYEKMLRIVVGSGYRGYVGIEYEGKNLGEYEGIKKTKTLLERIRTKLSNL
jgi:sugar phosphate isomerase/epimerase